MGQFQHSRRLLFLAAPSMALLDVVAELLFTLRKRHPDLRLSALFLDKKNANQVDPTDTVGSFAASLFDDFMLFENNRITNYPSLVAMHRRQFRSLKAVTHRRHVHTFQRFDAVVLDPSYESSPKFQSLLPLIPGSAPFFYFEHGVIPTPPNSRIPVLLGDRVRTIYVPYRNNDLNDFSAVAPNATVKAVGLLRTHRSYTTRVKERSRWLHKDPPPNSALVIARPMPIDALREVLSTLHESLWVRRGIPLVIRAHPKSAGKGKGGDIRCALPAELEGRSWMVSRGHPLHLAEGAKLAITFFSNLCFDLVQCGVPVIEYPSTNNSLYHKFVSPASSSAELETEIDFALRGESLGPLSAAVDAFIVDPPDLETVVSDLSAALFGNA